MADVAELYDNEHVKTAGADTASIALRLALAALLLKSQGRTPRETYQRVRDREQRNEEVERQRVAPAQNALRYTRPPVTVAPVLPGGGYGDGTLTNIPVGLDVGMVRLASDAGRSLATKIAGVAPTEAIKALGKQVGDAAQHAVAKPGFWGKSFGPGKTGKTLLGLGAVAAAGYAGNKALNKAQHFMSEEATPADWGNRSYGAPSLSFGVNQYGYAQPGTPFAG